MRRVYPVTSGELDVAQLSNVSLAGTSVRLRQLFQSPAFLIDPRGAQSDVPVIE